MNSIFFSTILGIIISFTNNNYFFKFKKNQTLLAFVIDIVILSFLSYITIYVLGILKSQMLVFILLSFIILMVFFIYLIYFSPQLFLKNSRLERSFDLENLFFRKFDKKINILICKPSDRIRVLLDRKNVLIPHDILQKLELMDICNIIAFYYKTNKFNVFILLYLIPITIFYLSFTYAIGDTRTLLVIIASILIPVIKRLILFKGKNNNLRLLKKQINKYDLIESLKKYHLLLSKISNKNEKLVNDFKMKKSIETVNKYL